MLEGNTCLSSFGIHRLGFTGFSGPFVFAQFVAQAADVEQKLFT